MKESEREGEVEFSSEGAAELSCFGNRSKVQTAFTREHLEHGSSPSHLNLRKEKTKNRKRRN